MTTFAKPHRGDTPEEVRDKINRSVPFRTPRQVDPSISPVLERIILKAMSRAPEDRYQSATGMMRALEVAARTPWRPAIENALAKETKEVARIPLFTVAPRS